MPNLSLIVAMSQNKVIGKNNALPWHLPEDLRRFKEITMGHPIIMGRKTFESIGRPLPGRRNIVVTRNPLFHADGIQTASTLKEALNLGHQKDEALFVIGGASLFKEAYPQAQKIYLTCIEKQIDGDVFFPELDWENDFNVIEKTETLLSQKENLPYRYITLSRKLSV